MTLNDERRAYMRCVVALLDRVPNDTWVEVSDLGISFQGHTQAHAAEIRALFPGVFWNKLFVGAGCNWWEYTAEFDGVRIKIYAVSEAPASCRRIVEEEWVEERVPVTFQVQRVKRERVRWDCTGGAEVQS